MAKVKDREVTEPCPDCSGSGFFQTPAPVVCSTCGGAGIIPKGEIKQMREKAEPDAAQDE